MQRIWNKRRKIKNGGNSFEELNSLCEDWVENKDCSWWEITELNKPTEQN